MKFRIVRTTEKGKDGEGTFGVLHRPDGTPFLVTVELPWRDNQPDISCIPAGTYKCKMLMSPHFQRVLPHVMDVPGREAVEIHAANTVKDIKGCCGVGLAFTEIGDLPAIQWSASGLQKLLHEIGTATEFDLEIVEAQA